MKISILLFWSLKVISIKRVPFIHHKDKYDQKNERAEFFDLFTISLNVMRFGFVPR